MDAGEIWVAYLSSVHLHRRLPYGRRMAGGRSVQVRLRIETMPRGRHCGQACGHHAIATKPLSPSRTTVLTTSSPTAFSSKFKFSSGSVGLEGFYLANDTPLLLSGEWTVGVIYEAVVYHLPSFDHSIHKVQAAAMVRRSGTGCPAPHARQQHRHLQRCAA